MRPAACSESLCRADRSSSGCTVCRRSSPRASTSKRTTVPAERDWELPLESCRECLKQVDPISATAHRFPLLDRPRGRSSASREQARCSTAASPVLHATNAMQCKAAGSTSVRAGLGFDPFVSPLIQFDAAGRQALRKRERYRCRHDPRDQRWCAQLAELCDRRGLKVPIAGSLA